MYQENKSYNVIKGTVPDFGYDVKFAVLVDEQKTNEIPTEPKNEQGQYYKVNVDCGKSKTTGEWDYNAWNVKLENIEEGSRCKLLFTSNLSEEEYNKYIDAGVALRRNTYRGKDITEYYNNKSLYDMISSGKFDDIYVGDYITTNIDGKSIKWLIADLDNYLYTGDAALTRHHATIIPAQSLQNASMNTTNDTTGGYYGSKMVTETLPSVLETYIRPAFKDHIITYKTMLTTEVNTDMYNRAGSKGASSKWGWYDRELDLMSEANVYGTIVYSSSGFDTGIDKAQYAIFQLKPEMINNGYMWFWLKDVVSTLDFAGSCGQGHACFHTASYSGVVLPRFLID